ncbi:MAG: Exodeoxyribonuclease VII large subunit, partial [uncultured Gemmatimonadetes bacterium]
ELGPLQLRRRGQEAGAERNGQRRRGAPGGRPPGGRRLPGRRGGRSPPADAPPGTGGRMDAVHAERGRPSPDRGDVSRALGLRRGEQLHQGALRALLLHPARRR